MEEKVTYFEEMGIVNTGDTLRITRRRADETGVRTLLIASTFGHTIGKAFEVFDGGGYNFIVVGGEREEFPDEVYQSLVDGGHRVIFNSDYDFSYPEMAWEILRRFCEGMKVCVEMTLIATDLGILAAGEEVIAIAGTGRYGFEEGGRRGHRHRNRSRGEQGLLRLRCANPPVEERRQKDQGDTLQTEVRPKKGVMAPRA